MIDVFCSILKSLVFTIFAYLVYSRVIKIWYLRWLYGKRGVVFLSNIPVPLRPDTNELFGRVME